MPASSCRTPIGARQSVGGGASFDVLEDLEELLDLRRLDVARLRARL
jgi:hypothetical protein